MKLISSPKECGYRCFVKPFCNHPLQKSKYCPLLEFPEDCLLRDGTPIPKSIEELILLRDCIGYIKSSHPNGGCGTWELSNKFCKGVNCGNFKPNNTENEK